MYIRDVGCTEGVQVKESAIWFLTPSSGCLGFLQWSWLCLTALTACLFHVLHAKLPVHVMHSCCQAMIGRKKSISITFSTQVKNISNMNLCWNELAASQGVNCQQCLAPSMRNVHLCIHHLTNTKKTRQLMNPPLPCTTHCDHWASLSLSAQEKKKSAQWPNLPPPLPPQGKWYNLCLQSVGVGKKPNSWMDRWMGKATNIYTKIKLK